MPVSDDTRRRAKAVIVALIRENGGALTSMTHLYKAFWKAHVAAAQAGLQPLTAYPIVKMPRGPGVHDASALLGQLMAERAITMDEPDEPYTPFEFTIRDAAAYDGILTPDEMAAIRDGLEYVRGKTATELRDESHRDSRSWNATRSGAELDIDLDSIPEAEYAERREALQEIGAAVDKVFRAR